MSTILSSVLKPLHIIAFSSLLGSTLYHTFVITKVCFNELPSSAFTTLQKKLFPIYFRTQVGLLALSALSYPTTSLFSLARKPNDLIPLCLAAFTATLNLVIYEPRTRDAMIKRIHQGKCFASLACLLYNDTYAIHTETIDGRKHDAEDVSEEMRVRKRSFSRAHAMCIHINLLSIAAMLWYGVNLGGRLSFD